MTAKRNIYLKMKTLQEAREILFSRFTFADSPQTETVPVPDAVDRILAEPVFARISSPNFHASAMDGIAVKAETTFGASEGRPKELRIGRDAFHVNTGHVLPKDTDAVIMIEHIHPAGADRVVIEKPAFPWQYVRKMGEDIVATELLFPRNHRVTPYCIGALLSGGIFEVPVIAKPKVFILPTGSELVDWRRIGPEMLKPGQVYESNSYVLESLVNRYGGAAVRSEKLKDDFNMIKAAVARAVSDGYQSVLIIGGSSAGSEDYAKPVISELGEILVHGVTIMPGKPVIIGDVAGVPVCGIPGYPVSAIIAFEQFVRPLLCGMLRQPDMSPMQADVIPTRKMSSKLGVEEFVRVKLGRVGDRIVATQLPRGAGSITSITEADGIIRIPQDVEGIHENASVKAELLKPLSHIENTLVVVGSHDNTLDILADELRAVDDRLTLSSSHVGSMGGLMAIRRGACHLAGSHLLDTTDGRYNVSYVQRYLKGIKTRLVHLVMRSQGLMVARGNPKKIRGIEDLVRNGIHFINRQSGSGTRILLDYRLEQLGLDPEEIDGYRNEEYTHMAVAVAVLSNAADAGLGIYAAAKALDLDFVPVVTEQYDLVIPEAHFGTENIQRLLTVIGSDRFKRRVEALGGYSTEKTGTVWEVE